MNGQSCRKTITSLYSPINIASAFPKFLVNTLPGFCGQNCSRRSIAVINWWNGSSRDESSVTNRYCEMLLPLWPATWGIFEDLRTTTAPNSGTFSTHACINYLVPLTNLLRLFNPSMDKKSHVMCDEWGEATYTFRHFNGCPDEVCGWISSLFPHFITSAITFWRVKLLIHNSPKYDRDDLSND